ASGSLSGEAIAAESDGIPRRPDGGPGAGEQQPGRGGVRRGGRRRPRAHHKSDRPAGASDQALRGDDLLRTSGAGVSGESTAAAGVIGGAESERPKLRVNRSKSARF